MPRQPQFRVVVPEVVETHLEESATHLGITSNTLSTLILTHFSAVRPEKVFEALGSIPESLKRPGVSPGPRI